MSKQYLVNEMLQFFCVDFEPENKNNDWYMDNLLTMKEYIKYLENYVEKAQTYLYGLNIDQIRNRWEIDWLQNDNYDDCGKIYIGPTQDSGE